MLPVVMTVTNIIVIFCYVSVALVEEAARKWSAFLILSAALFCFVSVSTIVMSTYPFWPGPDKRLYATILFGVQYVSGFLACMALIVGAFCLRNYCLEKGSKKGPVKEF